jgi:arabinose-5-phosphate isomerase
LKLVKNIQSIAKEVLLQEGEAVKQLADLIDASFQKCVEEILQSTGRIVVTGIGKSAIIGQKIVATLNSTGTPALFMHAADAIHGDLGMIQPDDIVIVISKSGDTPEIKVLVPLLKRIGVTIIGLVSNKSSFLARESNLTLHAKCEKEADPLNLAPTTSTTVTLALGDALAICLLEARGFTSQDFAKYHPGGSLGKKLYLKVGDLFPSNLLPVVPINAALKDVIMEITSKRLGATAVVENQKLVGIITDGDLRRMLNQHSDDSLLGLTAAEIMTRSPITISADHYAVSALQLMQSKSITQLIVVASDSTVVGFIHLHDLLKEGLM